MEGYIFDYRLGYIREGCEMQGFDVIGKGNRRMVALGGYTTPEIAKNRRSWAHSLSGRMNGAQILLGCTDGYSSAQILVMFIREAILLQPETVVCLSGFYNIAYNLGLVKNGADAALLKTHPFTTPEQLHFLREITSGFGLGNQDIYYGEENHLSGSELWLWQMAEIKCLCDEFGIKFKSYIQPCLFSGKYTRNTRENAFISGYYGLKTDEIEAISAAFQSEYEILSKKARDLEYVFDLSGALDDCGDAYIDACHVKDELLFKITENML